MQHVQLVVHIGNHGALGLRTAQDITKLHIEDGVPQRTEADREAPNTSYVFVCACCCSDCSPSGGAVKQPRSPEAQNFARRRKGTEMHDTPRTDKRANTP